MILRRLYVYLVSVAALGLLVAGVSLLGTTILLFVMHDPSADQSRAQLAVFAAMTLVAAPVWGLHYWFGLRFARRDVAERASALRRLYLYLACLGLVSALAIVVGIGIDAAIEPSNRFVTSWQVTVVQQTWAAGVLTGFWLLHLRAAKADREAAGEHGASAALRRWYMYPAAFAGLLTMLSGAGGVISSTWQRLIGKADVFAAPLSGPIAALAAGFGLWAVHAWMTSRGDLYADDRRSTLRAVEGFLLSLVTMIVALAAASQVLYYALARLLGISSPGGVSGDLAVALAGPVPLGLVYGAAWLLVRRRLGRDAAGEEASRQAGVRRLHTNLTTLISLGALATGAAGVLWVAAEQLESPVIGVTAPGWKDALSLWVTLLAVGLGVWLAHWRSRPEPAERQALSRRLYVYAALLGSVMALLGSAVAAVNAVLRQVVSSSPQLSDPANLDVGRALALVVVAAVIGVYHWRVLRADQRARPAQPVAEPEARPHHRYELELVGAETEDLRRALAALPAGATYRVVEQAP